MSRIQFLCPLRALYFLFYLHSFLESLRRLLILLNSMFLSGRMDTLSRSSRIMKQSSKPHAKDDLNCIMIHWVNCIIFRFHNSLTTNTLSTFHKPPQPGKSQKVLPWLQEVHTQGTEVNKLTFYKLQYCNCGHFVKIGEGDFGLMTL